MSSKINITKSGTVTAIKVSVNITHAYIGDLRVTLTSPSGKLETLHAQLGGSADNLVATYDSASPGVLAAMLGQPMKGDWVLNVSDRARQDLGRLRNWKIELKSASAGSSPPSAEPVPVAVSRPAGARRRPRAAARTRRVAKKKRKAA